MLGFFSIFFFNRLKAKKYSILHHGVSETELKNEPIHHQYYLSCAGGAGS